MRVKKDTISFKMQIRDCCFVLKDDYLSVLYKGEQAVRFNLVPIIDEKEFYLGKWDKRDKEFVARTQEGSFSVHIGFEKDYLIYWLEGDFKYVRSLIYFSGSRLKVNEWQTYVSDRYDTSFDTSLNRDVMISSSDLRDEMSVDTWMMSPQPKVCSFRLGGDDSHWLGLSCPLPYSLERTCFSIRDKKFSVEFREIFPSSNRFPKVFIIPGLKDNYAVLKVHAEITRKFHLVREKKPYYKWWSYPIFCTWGEQFMSDERLENQIKILNEKVVSKWVDILKEKTGISHFNIIIDIGWFDKKGDFRACPDRFAHMRELVDKLKGDGHHVLLWMTPFFVAMDSNYAKNYSEGLVKDRRGNIAIEHSYWDIDKDHYLKDYSLDKTRKCMEQIIKYCLSDEKGCLNADGFKIDYNFQTPASHRHRVAHPEWGTGDEMYRKIIEFIHETAHKFKKDAIISISGNETYLHPHINILRLNDHFGAGIDDWCKRARIASYTLPGVLFDTDGWFMSRNKSLEYLIVSAVIGIPSIHHLTQFDDSRRLNPRDLDRTLNAIEKTEISDLPLRDEDFRRLAATWTVYLNCPTDPTMELCIEPERNIFWRKYTRGKFKGFYSALAIERRCLVTYSYFRVLITATKNFRVEVPLPPGVEIKKIIKVSHAGYIKELSAKQMKKGRESIVPLEVEDAAGETKFIEIDYS